MRPSGADGDALSARAHWIWDGGGRWAYHRYVEFRREFDCNEPADPGELLIAADAFYQAWLNGVCIGHGPAKSPANSRFVDRIPIRPGVWRAGTNALEILTVSLGTGTMTYCPGPGGLIFELRIGRARISSNEEVRVRACVRRNWRTVRRWMLPCVEDVRPARATPWKPASLVGSSAILSPRPSPLPSRAGIRPRRVVACQRCEAPDFQVAFRLRPLLANPGEKRANELFNRRGLVVTELMSPCGQSVCFTPTLGPVHWYFRGRRLFEGSSWSLWDPEKSRPRIRLREGANLLVGLTVAGHTEEASLCAFTEAGLEARNPFGMGSFTFIPCGEGFDPARAFGPGGLEKPAADAVCPPAGFSMPDSNAFDLALGARVCGDLPLPDPPGLRIPPGARVVLDFGRVVCGWLAFGWEAASCGRLVFAFCEGFEQAPSLRIHWPDGCNNGLSFRHEKGAGEFESFFAYGVRVLVIHNTGTEPVLIDNLRILSASCSPERVGSLRTDSLLINEIHDLCANTIESGTDDTFVDCPTFEQVNWNFDNRITALADATIFGNYVVARNSLLLFVGDEEYPGLVRCHGPSTWKTRIPIWSFHWILWVWDHYWLTGDRELVAAAFPQVRAGLREALGMIRPDGLLAWPGAWHLVEWGKGRDDDHAVNTAEQAALAAALSAGIRLASITGDAGSARKWAAALSRLIDAARRHLWCRDRGVFADSLHEDGTLSPVSSQATNAMAGHLGLASPHQQRRIHAALFDGSLLPFGSPYGLYPILEFLSLRGDVERLFGLIERHWGTMLLAGDRTAWEHFAEFGHGAWPTRSRCHPFSAYPAIFFARHLLGMTATRPGFEEIAVRPDPPAWINSCGGTLPTPHGPVRVHWTRDGAGTPRCEFSVPQGVRCRKASAALRPKNGF